MRLLTRICRRRIRFDEAAGGDDGAARKREQTRDESRRARRPGLADRALDRRDGTTDVAEHLDDRVGFHADPARATRSPCRSPRRSRPVASSASAQSDRIARYETVGIVDGQSFSRGLRCARADAENLAVHARARRPPPRPTRGAAGTAFTQDEPVAVAIEWSRRLDAARFVDASATARGNDRDLEERLLDTVGAAASPSRSSAPRESRRR